MSGQQHQQPTIEEGNGGGGVLRAVFREFTFSEYANRHGVRTTNDRAPNPSPPIMAVAAACVPGYVVAIIGKWADAASITHSVGKAVAPVDRGCVRDRMALTKSSMSG